MIISDNGFGSVYVLFKIRNILVSYNILKNDNMMGSINMRLLKIFKNQNSI